MADFKTHISTSTVLGIAYGCAGYHYAGLPGPSCVLAGGLCSVAGMLPDLDSGSGVPLRESVAFAAAVIPMMMLDRFEQMGLSRELVALAGGSIYLLIRFGLAALLKNYTVHRGMFHSIPAALIAWEVGFLVSTTGSLEQRYYKATAILLGYLSHLVLDEIWSVRVGVTGVHVKKSFGSALKWWSQSPWGTFSTYAKLLLLGLLVLNDPVWVQVSPQGQQLHEFAGAVIDRIWR